jgi:hypothetical protein
VTPWPDGDRGGPYDDPLGGPLGGGGNPGGGNGEGHPNPPLQGRVPTLPTHGSLKGTPLAIFNGNRKNTKQFTQEFTLYHMINQDTSMMRNAYTCTTLALSFMCGLAINDWVLQQTDRLYLKCNRDVLNGIASTYCTDDEQLWVEFG